jgi:hypothetical protein
MVFTKNMQADYSKGVDKSSSLRSPLFFEFLTLHLPHTNFLADMYRLSSLLPQNMHSVVLYRVDIFCISAPFAFLKQTSFLIRRFVEFAEVAVDFFHLKIKIARAFFFSFLLLSKQQKINRFSYTKKKLCFFY